jgi:hypothetical protein
MIAESVDCGCRFETCVDTFGDHGRGVARIGTCITTCVRRVMSGDESWLACAWGR